MKKFEKYSNWIFIFVLFVIGVTVYKTFDNFYVITDGIAFLIDILSPFIIGFIIYIPFIVIDMVVASALMSMGMMMAMNSALW